ncbi:hypothetical protein EH31_05600 [Erythrobacter longus]|uniref:Uncharacterized protein n=1 Tax=Erythrobacter longus TaxID=1044 RepID=A0A074N2K6_ERYLO|nr:hypothetical protein [Erythrobacter longus]KEO92142.1 hypothetical protein EH31_05600 [Erythrobacter longus]
MRSYRLARVIAACAALLTTAPALAQFGPAYASTPPEGGQTLLDWADPPILKHTIPEEERADT